MGALLDIINRVAENRRATVPSDEINEINENTVRSSAINSLNSFLSFSTQDAVEPEGTGTDAEKKCATAQARTVWTAEDWRVHFDERAGIFEHDGGLSRIAAEAQAFECCIIEWLNRNAAPSQSGRCTWCGKIETPRAVILPFGTEPGSHSWLHAECWPNWHQTRMADAIAALKAYGVTPDRSPRNSHD